jgi:hypothetical protein
MPITLEKAVDQDANLLLSCIDDTSYLSPTNSSFHQPWDMSNNTLRVVTDNDSGYDADDASNSPTTSNGPLLPDDGNFFLSLAAQGLLATAGDSSMDADDSGVFSPLRTRTSILRPDIETQCTPHLSRKDRLQDVLTYLWRFKLSPMDLFSEVVDRSNDKYEAYRVKMYGEPG